MKKLFFNFILIFSFFIAQGQSITVTTTSTSGTWSPSIVTNSGATLRWTASGGGIATQVLDVDDPIFDLSLNTGTVTILVESTDGFSGLSTLWLNYLTLTSIDLSNAINLTSLGLRGNRNLGTIDLSPFLSLTRLDADVADLTSIDLSQNDLINNIRINSNDLTSIQLDKAVNDLDANGAINGSLFIANQSTGESLTNVSFSAYNNLIGKGWTIDVPTPPNSDINPPTIGVLNPPTNVLTTSLTLDWTAATDNVGVTAYNVYKGGVIETTLGNVLTYDVSGLASGTNYDFFVTALDAAGNESSQSNTQNITTNLPASSITVTTTSTSGTWSPSIVTNSGATLRWTASGGGIATQVLDVDDPIFDLSLNTGTVTILVESTDGFSGLSTLWLNYLTLTSIDLSNAINLTSLGLRGNRNLGTIDLSPFLSLTRLDADVADLTSIDLSQNDLINNIRINSNDLTSIQLDKAVNDLDANGAINGSLFIANQSTGESLTNVSFSAYNNLIGKGWTIDVPTPPNSDINPPTIGVLNPPTNVLTTSLTLDWTAATDNVGVTAYNVYKGGVIETTLGNVLTYDVSGLASGTNYDFFVTALDAAGNESSQSNTQNITTNLPASSITVTTTSTSGTWSPSIVTNSGATLRWTASGGGIATQVLDVDDPIFDLSLNTGTVTILVESTDGFSGLSTLWLNYLTLTSIDLSNAINLTSLGLRGNRNLGTIDLSPFLSLTRLDADVADLTSIDLSQNDLINNIRINSNDLTSIQLDKAVNDLDANGAINGSLFIANQSTGESLTSASLVAYNNLITRGWTIDVPAPTPAPGPEINITGNGVSILSGNTPIVGDDTDFGQVAIGTPVTKTFTIENLGDSDLTINFFFTSGTDFTFDPPGGGGIVIGSGSSTTIDATFNPLSVGVKTGMITINNTDPNEGTYIVNLTAEGIPASSGTIDVQGNGISIANGDLTPVVTDDTDFGPVLNNTTKTTTYTIYNNHATENLTVNSITLGFGVNEFQMGAISETLPFDIAPGGSITFDVAFTPLTATNYQTSVQIDNSETGQNPFQYNIAGQGADVVVSGNIMISQYYEGTGNNKWVEVKNISGSAIPAGTYFLALYKDSDIANITSQPPTASISIPAMAVNEVLLFRNAGELLPTAGNLGPAIPIDATAVCSFTGGDDVILISSTNNSTTYANREDIIGTVPSTVWGGIFSYIRGGANEVPEADFNILHWIELSVGGDVDIANPNTNIALGTQDVGLASWTGSWSNGIEPDRTRNVELTSDYNAFDGTFTAGNLVINSNLNFDGGTTNSVIVYNDLTINGTFTIGNQESLVIYGTGTITGNITKLENSTFRNDKYDVTYWSSPIKNANLGTVFAGVDPNRIFLYNQDNTSATNPLDPTYYDVWEVASGPMIKAKGYATDGPTGTTGVQSISFTGTPNSGTVSIELANLWLGDGDPENDYNLIGNPYASAIDSDLFINGNAKIGGTIYLWTHTTAFGGNDYTASDYATLNLGGGVSPGGGTVLPKIGSSQGFLVTSTAAGLVNFTSGMQIPNANNQFYKTDHSKTSKNNVVEKDRIWLNINSDQGGSNQILVAFMEKATEAVDRGYDALIYKNSDNPLSFYSTIDNSKYVIQGLPTFNESQTVNLGFDTKVAPRTFTISIHKVEGALKNTDIYLVDHLLNVTHDLKAGDYQFEQTTPGEFKDRFTLQFAGQALGVEDDIVANQKFIISQDFDNLKVRANKNVTSIKVYDLMGRMLMVDKPNKKSFELRTNSIKKGTVLLIQANLENGSTINRKTIKY